MTQPTLKATESLDNVSSQSDKSHFPQAMLSVSREEFDALQLTVKQGLTEISTELPPDLTGYVFIVGPAGSVDSPPKKPNSPHIVDPSTNGWTPLYNGDGMLYRIGFENGKAHLKTRIAKPLSYWADKYTYENSNYANLGFKDFGIARASLALGVTSQLSVTLTPFKKYQADPYRLLITVDMGRSYEVDPNTMEVVQPIGLIKDWKAVNPLFPKQPFPLSMSCAHPCFDYSTGELFTINLGRSISSFLPTLRQFLYQLRILTKPLKKSLGSKKTTSPLDGFIEWLSNLYKNILKAFLSLGKAIYQLLEKIYKTVLQILNAFAKDDFVELVCWRGEENFDRWKVVLPNGKPIKVKQTLHQMGLTKNYIVLADTAFKIALEELLFAEHWELIEEIEFLIRELTDIPQLADTKVWIVPREKLIPGEKTVTAHEVIIPREIAHYVVEYEDADGIVIHTVHSCACDAAETIRRFDKSVYSDVEINNRMRSLPGVLVSGMDVGIIGCHVIDPAKLPSSDAVRSCLIERDFSWGDPVYAYREMTLKQPEKIDDIYWIFFGAWEELLPQFVGDIYKDYKYRKFPISKVKAISQEGRASTLCRVHVERKKNGQQGLEIELTTPDYYEFPAGHFANSPQFVPRQGGDSSSTDGYLICVVLSDRNDGSNNSELWLFDAANLKSGPKYRLCSEQINIGFTIHTTWLPEVVSPPKSDYNVREDYEPMVLEVVNKYLQSRNLETKKMGEDIRALFDEIYQRFEGK
ncbi:MULTISPECIES: carotenoid oxygenase family protein [unclassified Microcoleus]|uniref:carotenoid oxygenase family protein n=1 Tax=unclassified Microcoleus TaxID=2642155 RepID=UPI002FCED329